MSDTTQDTTTEPFDPSAHSVDEVNAYLKTASPEEQARVVEAEKAGKDRSTVTIPAAAKQDDPPPAEPVAEAPDVEHTVTLPQWDVSTHGPLPAEYEGQYDVVNG